MKKIFVVPNPNKDKGLLVTAEAVKLLSMHGGDVYMSDVNKKFNIPCCKYESSLPKDIELIIVIGGDGSFIDASTYATELDIPILGINMGKVGYLSEVEPGELDSLVRIFTGEFDICRKMLLSIKLISNGEERELDRFAVNDICLTHNEHIGIADFLLFSNEGGVRYRADGVVIATPQGSTAYSLSAGGPVVSHEAEAVIVTPIAPHTFFNRSLVFGKGERIKVKNTGQMQLNISVDGRSYAEISPNECCEVFVPNKSLKVLTFKENNMFSNLFGKIQIIEDII